MASLRDKLAALPPDTREQEKPFHLRCAEGHRFGDFAFGAITLTRGEAEFMVARSPDKYTAIEPAERWGEKMSRLYFEYYTEGPGRALVEPPPIGSR